MPFSGTAHSPTQAYHGLDMDLLRSNILQSENAFNDSLEVFESVFDERSAGVLVERLLSDPGLFELVMSSASDRASEFLSGWLMGQFPTSAKAFSTSLPYKVLSRLSLSLLFLDYPSDPPANLAHCRRSVELTCPVLEVTSSLSFADEPTDIGGHANEFEDNKFVKFKTKSQRHVKKSKRDARKPTVDLTSFQNLSVDVPRTREQADKLIADLLEDQKGVLQYYLTLLRRADMNGILRRTHLPPAPAVVDDLLDNGKMTTAPECSPDSLVVDEKPSAYPNVQPMKAALYFDSADGFGQWHILISTRADRNLREARRADKKTFGIIVKKIKELSNGHFSDDNQKRLTGSDIDIPIFEAKMTRDLRLVYQVDCIPEFDSEVERQVIKIFGIYTHAQLDARLWDSMSRQLARKGKEYKLRCIFRNRPHHVGDNVIMPASFPPQTEPREEEVSSAATSVPVEYLEELHSMLVLEKFVTLSQALLNSIFADHDVAHVFAVSPQEQQIIEHTSSCYVLGRSGTGKTTTMLFKMLGIERSWRTHSDTMPKPRQLFVTQSRVLSGRVEEYFLKLMESLSLQGASPQELANIARKKVDQRQEDLVDQDDEANWRSDLPTCFSQLRDEHFPLFLTFDRLCSLLEADLASSLVRRGDASVPLGESFEMGKHDHSALNGDRKRPPLSYPEFLQQYWPHFPEPVRKGLDPALVFSEFIGVIKGSEEALNTPERFLDQYAYTSLSHRSQSTFSTQRDSVYFLFQHYMKRKRSAGDIDTADRTHKILGAFREEGFVGKAVDFLYVDEVQDNLLIDIPLLRSLCKNPDGLFWAGDTAQTIAVGSNFRFDDLKAVLYRIEAARGATVWLSTPPRSFQLAVNYRSHGGIVRCAHSVIALITQFWPYAIDILAEEKGIIDGAKPVFFTGWDTDTVRYEQFLFGDTGTRIEFGAQQCILVRDDSAREKLRKEVGEVGLIMTLYESKGLEFDDVLLFNFFEDSTVDASQWRVILNAMEEGDRCKIPAPRFDATRHAGVCSELKFLYVAITRARKNMWIVDCSARAEPMRVLWKGKSLVQICTPGTDVPQLAVSSAPEEWEKSGRNLFQHKRYFQAMHCFTRAGLDREVLVANAYHLRELARSQPLKSPTRSQAFLATAEAFIGCARTAHYDKENVKRIYFKNAAESYMHAGDDPKAAEAYQDACEFTLAAQHYRKAGLFDEAVEVIRAHRSEMSEPVANQIVHVARLFYVKESRLDNAIKLFSSPEEGLEFMEEYDLDIARATLLEKMGQVAEAAEVHLSEGRPLEAIRLFLSDRESVHSASRGKQCLLAALWQQISFGGASSTSDGAKNLTPKLLGLASDVSMEDMERDEISMFSAFNSRDWTKMLQLGKIFGNRNPAAALFCLDVFFGTLPKIQVSSRQEVGATLQTFLLYIQLLASTARHKDPCGTSFIRKLFNFEISDQMVLVKAGTFLHGSLLHSKTAFRDDERGSLVTTTDFLLLFKRALADRLSARVESENELCRKARALQPCLQEAVLGSCNTTSCDKDHLPGASFTADGYNELVRLHLLQISIFHTVHFVQLPNHIREEQFAFWLRRLYEVMHPPHYLLGHPSDLNWHGMPEAETSRKVVTTWLRHLLYTLDPGSATAPNFLPVASQAAALMFVVAPDTAHEIIARAPFFNAPRPPRQLIRPVTNEYIIHDLLGFLDDRVYESISAGVLFLRHVLSNELPIHVDVFCDCMDHLCAAFVIYRKYERSLTLHGITLPRGWLATVLAGFDKLVSRDTRLIWMFEWLMEEILGHLFSRSRAYIDHLYFNGRRLADCSGRVRNIFIARIFRCMCLLGYNVGDPRLRNQILKGINSLRIHDRLLPKMCSRYVYATRWEDLARFVRLPPRDSKPDELIQLYDSRKRRDERPKEVTGVRLVGFKTIEELKVLKFHKSVLETSNLRAEATAFVPRQISPLSMDLNTAAESLGLPDDITEEEGGDVLDQADPDEVEQTMDNQDMVYRTNLGGDTPDTYSEQHAQAAQTLQVIFRRTRSKHRKAPRHGLPSARVQIFTTYLDASQRMIWPHNYYRLLFLGPLPHVVLCLEQSKAHIQTAKQKAKKRLKSAEHQELDEVSERLTKLKYVPESTHKLTFTNNPASAMLKVVNRLSKALEPKSDLHFRRNLVELVSYVVEVQTLVEQLPNDKKQALREDLALGLKGIVQEVGPPKKKAKPELSVDEFAM